MKIINSIFLFSLIILSCSSTDSESKKYLSGYNFNQPIQFRISNNLREISDLTLAADGTLFAINDEIGTVYNLLPNDGKIIKRFFLGQWIAEADFEGIAATEKFIYAISSKGKLYKFIDGDDGEAVKYELENLPFTSKFNIEGLCYDKDLNGLLIVPKDYAGKKHNDMRAIYFYSIANSKLDQNPLILISLKKLRKDHNIKDFYPSGIAKDNISGNYYLISARGENAIIEIDKVGNILAAQKLSEKIHRQPEGITILQDRSLIISDEAAGKSPTITIYKHIKDD